MIHARELKFTSTGQGDSLKIEPVNAENAFWTFEIAKKAAKPCPLEATYTVTGSVKGVPAGATLTFTHIIDRNAEIEWE